MPKPFKPPRLVGSSSEQQLARVKAAADQRDCTQMAGSSANRATYEAVGISSESDEDLEQCSRPQEGPQKESVGQTNKDAQDSKKRLPAQLLARLLKDSFKRDETQLTKEAMEVLQQYLDIFLREAVLRAYHERQQDLSGPGSFLDVSDLERLTPQLLLDFN